VNIHIHNSLDPLQFSFWGGGVRFSGPAFRYPSPITIPHMNTAERFLFFSTSQPELYLRMTTPFVNRSKNSGLPSTKYVWNARIEWCKKEGSKYELLSAYLACYFIVNTW
jgi:hypothetical protein